VQVYRPRAAIGLALGETTYDVTSRALVMGILNRTRDSFYAPAATYDLDASSRAPNNWSPRVPTSWTSGE
jgi:hypothetical protein